MIFQIINFYCREKYKVVTGTDRDTDNTEIEEEKDSPKSNEQNDEIIEI